MARFISINCYRNRPKIKLILPKKNDNKSFQRLGLRPQTPLPPAAGGFAPDHWAPNGILWLGDLLSDPRNSLLMEISGYAPNHMKKTKSVTNKDTDFCE